MSHRRRALAGVVLIAFAIVACRVPQRVTTGDGRCSVMMLGSPRYGATTESLGGETVRIQSWGRDTGDWSPGDYRSQVLRRATTSGSTAAGPAIVDDASARFARMFTHPTARGVQAGDYETPAVRRVATPAGPAVEVRSKLKHEAATIVASRFYPLPDGYCEVTIFGARSEDDVATYFDSIEIKP